MGNGEAVLISVLVLGAGVVVVTYAWRLFLAMVRQFTGAVRSGVRSQEEQDLIELGRMALAEMQALQQEKLVERVEPARLSRGRVEPMISDGPMVISTAPKAGSPGTNRHGYARRHQ